MNKKRLAVGLQRLHSSHLQTLQLDLTNHFTALKDREGKHGDKEGIRDKESFTTTNS